MNRKIQIRVDEETCELLEKLKKKLKITKSDIIRMAIAKFANYVEKEEK